MKQNKLINATLKSTCIALISLSAASFSTVSQADDLLRLATSLCEAAESDDRSAMRKKLKSAKIRLRNIFDGVHCGTTGDLLRVATKSNSMEAATFIATKIGKKNLAAAGPDGKTIIQWTEGLVTAGDASKQAFIDLYASKL